MIDKKKIDKKLSGLISSVPTSFSADYSVDYEGIKESINFLIDSKIDGIMLTGTAGEFINLTEEERKEIWKVSYETAKDRTIVVAHTGDSSTMKTLELTNYANELGIEYVMIMTPYITTPTQKEIYEHYKYIAENTKGKIIIYNNPGRVGVTIDSDTIIALAEIDNIVAVKDSSRDLNLTLKVIAGTKNKNFSVLSGEEDLLIPIIAMGGNGAIITTTAVYPEMFLKIYRAAENGEYKKANEYQHSILDFKKCLAKSGQFHAAIKACIDMSGRHAGPPRLPLMEISLEHKEELENYIEKYSLN